MSNDLFGVIHFSTYLIGTLIIILLPGPNSLFVLSTAARKGITQGYRAACGVMIGDAILMGLASLGVAKLLRSFPPMFLMLKYAGGAYLAYLGVGMLIATWRDRSKCAVEGESLQFVDEQASSERSLLRRALGVSLLNPKSILFCIAFFIQFVDPAYPHKALSFAILGVAAQAMSFLYLSLLIFGGARLATAFRHRRRARAALNGGTGALFVSFGAKLATASLG